MRRLLEAEVIRDLPRASREQLAAVIALNDAVAEAGGRLDVPEMRTRNQEFHFAIFRLSPRTLIVDEIERLWDLAAPYHAMYLYSADGRRTVLAEHAEMIGALRKGDNAGLAALMEQHRHGSETLPVRGSSGYLARRDRAVAISCSAIDAAMPAFNDSMPDAIGMLTSMSQADATIRDRPRPSEPTTRTIGPSAMVISCTSTSPSASRPDEQPLLLVRLQGPGQVGALRDGKTDSAPADAFHAPAVTWALRRAGPRPRTRRTRPRTGRWHPGSGGLSPRRERR